MSTELIEEAALAYRAACDAVLPNPGDAREAPVREGIAAVVALVAEHAAEVARRRAGAAAVTIGKRGERELLGLAEEICALAAGTEG